ncbi:MAG: biotin/lipoyl-binding protein [Anaerolineales bacterium]|nr:biotin/lipoyl-binding protein [Anaerolineales bacterium]NUQ86071.1 biotin/lipoyl-binding protein [Anaerolineales bacterium]
MKITFDNTTIDLVPTDKSYRVTLGDKTAEVEILRAKDGQLELLIDGKRLTAYVSSDGAKRWVTVNGRTFVLTKSSGARKSGGGQHHAAGELTAPMPGQIRAVNVREGDAVTKGQTLMILEAMKMEIRIQAPMDGVVKSLAVKQGQTVEREQILVVVAGQTSKV